MDLIPLATQVLQLLRYLLRHLYSDLLNCSIDSDMTFLPDRDTLGGWGTDGTQLKKQLPSLPSGQSNQRVLRLPTTLGSSGTRFKQINHETPVVSMG